MNDSLQGIQVRCDSLRECRCGEATFEIGPPSPTGVHIGRFICASCGSFCGWLPKRMASYISESVDQCGRAGIIVL